MTTYYKATRPDGRDFRTGTVDYAAALLSGGMIRHPTSTAMVPDDAATYLSVSTEPADCTGFAWPCRLFVVEPDGDVLGNLDYPNKRAVLALRVVEELPAWQALGPNGEAVEGLIERARTITTDQARQLDAAWYAARDAAWYAARDAAWYAARDAARDAAWYAARAAARDAARDTARDAAWDAAWDAARDAALALCVRDLITPEQFDALYGPWASVMEDPE